MKDIFQGTATFNTVYLVCCTDRYWDCCEKNIDCFFKSAVTADRPLWITEGFFNLLISFSRKVFHATCPILLKRRTGTYLSMIGNGHFSSWQCSSSWFSHIFGSVHGGFSFSLSSGVHTAEKETFCHESYQAPGTGLCAWEACNHQQTQRRCVLPLLLCPCCLLSRAHSPAQGWLSPSSHQASAWGWVPLAAPPQMGTLHCLLGLQLL